MNVDAKLVKELREKTGAGMMDCKHALVESSGDIEKAVDFLRKSGVSKAEKKVSRDATEGIIYSYIHHGNRLGVLLELGCETDFVANTDGFQDLAHNIAMQIAATNPIALSREKVPQEVLEREKEIYSDQAKSSGKPEDIIEKMVEGRINKFYQESCLLEQNFIKDPDKKLKDIVTESIATLGENITVNRYIRFAIGETN
ncbi:MAG: elongation factor Ts [Candidatus Marinimicrobia bacterium]|nr:elongation factor Ts [Candidatus Neomarinimicrobiota bacterium]|tara:strand:- start:201 stop:800 length:600 start_codon:yes stop_codon:yes gene_type:complete